MRLKQTPSQTVGPYFAYGLTPEQYGYPFRALAGSVLIDDDTPGERIRIAGRVLDGAGDPVPDAMLEIWQADGEGRYAHPADPRASKRVVRGGSFLSPERDLRVSARAREEPQFTAQWIGFRCVKAP